MPLPSTCGPLAWWWGSRQSLLAQLAPLWLEYGPLLPQEIRSKSHGTPSSYVRDSLSRTRSAPIASSLGVTSMWAEELLIHVYDQPLAVGVPGPVMDLETAELVKVAANAFLATKISFINAMADVCEAAGADVVRLAEALAYDGVHSRGTELGEEHVAHRGVVVLPGVDQDDLRPAFFERVHHRLDLHEVRPGSGHADDSHGVRLTASRRSGRSGPGGSRVRDTRGR